jgi:uncharacterized membrane protein
MKAFIRKLNIEERKEYIYVVFYSFFQFISSFLTKIMSEYFQIKNYTFLCERGCVMSLICIFRIILIIRKTKNKKDGMVDLKNYKGILYTAFIVSLTSIFSLFSIYYCTISTYFAIIRISPLFALVVNKYKSDELKSYQTFSLILSIIATFIIVLPSLNYRIDKDQDFPFGIFSAILVVLLLVYADMPNTHLHSSHVDILIFFVGIFSGGIGCFLMISFLPGIDDLNLIHWFFIIINAISSYYSILFQIKTLKTSENIERFIPLSIFTVTLSLILGIVLFDQEIFLHDILGLLLIGFNVYFYTNHYLKNLKKNNLERSYSVY